MNIDHLERRSRARRLFNHKLTEVQLSVMREMCAELVQVAGKGEKRVLGKTEFINYLRSLSDASFSENDIEEMWKEAGEHAAI